MTVETFVETSPYLISGTGPYAIGHAYKSGAIRVRIDTGSVVRELDPAFEFSVSPAEGDDGDVTLDGTIAAAYDGDTLMIERRTPVEQGFAGATARERGLEGNVDQVTMAVQESVKMSARALRVKVDGELPPYTPTDGATAVWDDERGGFVNGPSATEIETAKVAAAGSAAAAAGSATAAAGSAGAAEGYASSANTHRVAAQTAQGVAEAARDTALGIKSARNLETRAALLAIDAAEYDLLPEKTVFTVDGLTYAKATGASAIPDRPGFVPSGTMATLRHFGCISDVTLNPDGTFTGGTDQSAKILAAVAWMQGGANRWLDGEHAAYLVTSTIAVTGAARLRNLNLLKNTNGRILQIQNNIAGPYALGTSYSEGDLDIDLASNMAAPLRPGQPFKIVSDAIDPANRDDGSAASQYRLGEWAAAGRIEVAAGNFSAGRTYRVKTVGTTDFVAAGAASNTVGEVFVAQNAGSGSGIAWDESQSETRITLSKPLKYFMGIDPADPALSEGLQTAGSFTTGRSYMILSVGSTDFTLIGASASTVGVVFTATGAGTGTGTAVANEAIVNGYTTAFDAKVLVPDASARVHLKDCTFCYAEGLAATVDAQAVQVKGYVDPVIEGCKVTRCYGAAFSTTNYNAIIRDCVALRCENNTSEGQYGYGISDQGGYGLKVQNFMGSDCRHVYTSSVNTEPTSETSPLALISTGRTMSTQITGGHGTGGNNAIWDTHHSTDGLHMVNLTAEDGNTAGFSMRGRGIRISNASVLSCNAGVSIFTEYDSGDANDDLFVAGKELTYFSDAQVNDLRVTASMYALNVSMAAAHFGGLNVYETEEPIFAQVDGIAVITGSHTWKCVDNVSAGSVIHAQTPTSYGRSVFPRTKIYIDGVVTLDASGANAGVVLFEVDDLCDVIVRGKVRAVLPAGATYAAISGDGTLRTEGSGEIHVTVNGAADNSVIADFADVYGQRVTSSDGTIDWHPARGNGQLVCLYSAVQPDSIVGTGAEIGNAFQFPNLLNIKKAMATTGEGRLHCKMHFYLSGGGAATLKWDSFGSYRSQVAMAAGETNTQLDMTISVRSATETAMTFHWQVGTGATITNEKTVNYSRSDTVADMTGSGSLIDFDPTVDIGSTLQITGYELFGTEGGLC